ncbi:Sulfotransferase 1B1 [Aphelenchoides besseyi]|nr:Sulfotransferase 1B1 [Aphelenchoides besseyi]KAI6235829.1 Sulfotransferase 1B1 [Aphelenchoides besseyi]
MSLDVLKDISSLQEKYFFRIPYAHIIADYVWPGLVMSPERVIDIRNMKFTADDILIASYPKSGTTWMCELVSALAYNGDTDAVRKVRQDERCNWIELEQNYWWVRAFYKYNKDQAEKDGSANRRRVFFTHLPLELLPESALNGDCKIVYVARNPKDNAVSFYHFHRMTRFLGLQHNMSWNEFFALYMTGSLYCGSWFEHVLGFWRFSQKNDKVLFCKFEDMKQDLCGSVDRIADFLEMKMEPSLMEKVYEHCTFDAMKKNPMANRNSNYLFDTNICKFMRKGIVGDWKNYFTFTQDELFQEEYEKRMKDTGLQFQFE